MSEPRHIFKVRVIKSAVKKFPFDVFYLVGAVHKSLLPQLFPWSLCLTLTEALWTRIAKLHINAAERRDHLSRLERPAAHAATIEAGIDRELVDFVVVPVLPLTLRGLGKKVREGQEHARFTPYLMAPQHADTKNHGVPAITDVLDDATVLFTPDGPVRPICHKCPRHLLHLQGECQLGSQTCYSELLMWQPEVYQHGQLQENDGDAAGSPEITPR